MEYGRRLTGDIASPVAARGGFEMIPKAVSLAVVAPVLASGALVFSAAAASAHDVPFTADLSGSSEVPAGDAAMTGTAKVTVNDEAGEVCATITSNVTGAVAMHIHKGAAGANGPVVVPLDPKTINGAKDCVKATTAIATAIQADPAGYYVNIHTPAAPGGAVRGQLAAAAPSGASAGSGGQARTDSGLNAALVILMVAGGGMAGAAGWRLVRR
jgi:CHRD domain